MPTGFYKRSPQHLLKLAEWRKTGNARRTHSLRKSRFYRIYRGIKTRCNNSNESNFRLYGGKGIKLLWSSFEEFRDDTYPSYLEHTEKFGEQNTSIDRIDNNGHYSKENCRWATRKEQARNAKYDRFIEFNNERKGLIEWAEQFGLKKATLWARINKSKWPIEKALTTPVRK